jgi:hypothetical protein
MWSNSTTFAAHWNRLFAPAILLLVGLSPGCQRSDHPGLGLVSGRVTLDGLPLANAIISFTPDGPGHDSSACTGPDGTYKLTYLRDIRGAVVGWHTVRITTADTRTGKRELLPARYNSKSKIRVDVPAGGCEFDFKLTSK